MRAKFAKGLAGILLLLSIQVPVALADTATISSAEIMSEAIDLACLDYQVVGGCVWMTCTLSLIHISEPTRQDTRSRIPSSA